MFLMPIGCSRTFVAFAFICLACAPVQAQDARSRVTATCDRWAASDLDFKKPSIFVGVAKNAIDAKIALPACMAAAANLPTHPRIMFQLGRALEADAQAKSARDAYRIAHELKHAAATSALAFTLEQGVGGPRDPAGARKLYAQAAAAGDATAMHRLAAMYEKGTGGPKDAGQARRLYEQAASGFERLAAFGSGTAMKQLASMYENGQGVRKDQARVQFWREQAQAYSAAADVPR